MIKITPTLSISETEFQFSAVRSRGSGGQNVNKVSSAIHLRFDIKESSLPETYKKRLLALHDHHLTKSGVIIIKAQKFRTQEKNKADAVERLIRLVQNTLKTRKKRVPTKPSIKAKQTRMDNKARRSKTKSLRSKIKTKYNGS